MNMTENHLYVMGTILSHILLDMTQNGTCDKPRNRETPPTLPDTLWAPVTGALPEGRGGILNKPPVPTGTLP